MAEHFTDASTAASKHEIILYDLASTKNVCFSPAVWRARLLLNYKAVPYKTVFVEFPDIEATLSKLGIPPNEASASKYKYTVPAIHHIPSNTHVMGSTAIARFLHDTYPHPPFQMQSKLGDEIETKARGASGKAFAISIMPREVLILSERSAEYFRRTREAELGCRLEDFLGPKEKEEKIWQASHDAMMEVSLTMMTNRQGGPFVLGAEPSWTDFFIAGSLQSAKVVHEDVFERIAGYEGFKRVYEGCLPWMERKD